VRAWTFLAVAGILYIPANLLPVIESSTLLGTTSNTILGGVRSLWDDGDYLIAIVIFTASIVIPGVKIASMAFLLSTTQAGWTWRPRGRSRIYRMVEVIGRWSMVDIYVGAALVALVQFSTIAQVSAGPAALPFAAVVVLTMMSAISFDPRLIWDAVDACP
jgi:paraquat-inducible protein A